MNSKALQLLFVASAVAVLAGCNLEIMTPKGGNVNSSSETHNCVESTNCIIEITDATYSESFTAIPKEGYVFSKWMGGDDFLCDDSTSATCTVDNTLLADLTGNPAIDAVIASSFTMYIMPVFEFVGFNPGLEGTYQKEWNFDLYTLTYYKNFDVKTYSQIDGNRIAYTFDAYTNEIFGIEVHWRGNSWSDQEVYRGVRYTFDQEGREKKELVISNVACSLNDSCGSIIYFSGWKMVESYYTDDPAVKSNHFSHTYNYGYDGCISGCGPTRYKWTGHDIGDPTLQKIAE